MDPKTKKIMIIAGIVVLLCCCSSSSAYFLRSKMDTRYCWPGDTYGTAACPGSCQGKNGTCNGGMQVTSGGRSCKWSGAGDRFDCSVTSPIQNFDSSKAFTGPGLIRF
jgi:hypothetical protein